MHFSAFENAYFLQSVGWAIINSFWQAGLLWLFYILSISYNKKLSAVFKYNIGLQFLFASFAWFAFTIIEAYIFLRNSSAAQSSLLGSIHLVNFQQLNSILPYLSFIYIGLLCFYTIKFFNSYQKIYSLQKSELLKAPLDLRMFTKNIALHIGIKNKVQVWLSQQIDVPSVIGFIKPVILLPAAIINRLTTEQLEAVLLHELAHIKRNDYFINLLQSFVEIVLCFNPFVKLLSNYIKQERENCCDDWVINYQYNKYQYANALLILEEQRKEHLLLAMAATNKKQILLNRIKRIFSTEPQTSFGFFQKMQIVFVCMLLFIGMISLFPLTNKSNNNIAFAKTIVPFYNQPLAIAYPISNKELITADQTTKLNTRPGISRKRTTKKQHTIKPDTGYTFAMINNGLLNNNKQIAIAANDKEDADSSYYVKIEEQQSGNKQMNIYYFQLSKTNGNTIVNPLILLSKPVVDINKTVDSAINSRRRVTL